MKASFRLAGLFVLPFIALMVWTPPSLQAAGEISSDRRIPKDAYAYVSIRNVAEFKTQFGKTSLSQMAHEAALNDFWAQIRTQKDAIAPEIEKALKISLDDLLAIPQGEVALAIYRGKENSVSFAIMVDFGDKEQTVQKLIDRGIAEAEKNGAQASDEVIDGTKVLQYVIPLKKGDNDADDDEKLTDRMNSSAWFIRDHILVVSNKIDDLRPVLLRWDGSHDAVLAANKTYQQVRDACRDDSQEHGPLVSWYVDPIGLFNTVLNMSSRTAMQAQMVSTLMPSLGIDKFRGIGGTIDLATNDFDSVSRTLFCIDQPPVGLMNAFQFPARTQAPPSWISKEFETYVALSWDVDKAYHAIESVFDTFQGKGSFARAVENMSTNPQFGGLHLKKDFLDFLTGDFHIAGNIPVSTEGKPATTLFALKLKDVATFKKNLNKLVNLPSFGAKVREFQGESLYELPLSSAEMKSEDDEEEEMEENKETPVPTAFSVTEGHLMIAPVQLLEQIMRGSKDSLEETPEYRRVAKFFPPQTSSITFQKQDLQFRELYNLLRSGGMNLGDDNSPIDFSKLPDIEVFRKYIAPSGSYLQPVSQGFRMISFGLKADH